MRLDCAKFFYLFLAFLSLVYVPSGWAQQKVFPVQASLQLIPPYSLYLNDYAGMDERLKVHLLLKDLTKTDYPVRLKLRIEGLGITVVSKNSFYTPPIVLNAGQATSVSGADLQPYFDPRNLLFQGLDVKAFTRQGGKLPEGIYRIVIEVQDYYRREAVSNEAASVISVFLSYPPLINQPVANSKLVSTFPQNLVFQWTPRHTASLNAAFRVAYKVRLVDVTLAGRSANEAMRSSRPLYETLTDHTQLIYGPGEPQLTAGNTYALQVQAVETEGKDVFVNQGYSEVVEFVYGEKCSVPYELMARLEDQNALRLSWTPLPGQHRFSVRCREAGSEPTLWYEQEVLEPHYIIRGLKSGVKYEYQVSADCGSGPGDYTRMREFEMPDAAFSSGDFVCGETEAKEKVDRTNLLTAFSPHTIFFAAGFPVKVTEVEVSGDKISGIGVVEVPFLKKLGFEVEFDDIQINKQYQLASGRVRIRRQTLESTLEESLAAILVTPDSDGSVQAIVSNDLPTIIDVAIAHPMVLPHYNPAENTIKFKDSDSREVTIHLKKGQPPLVFQDKNGETFEVDQGGVITSRGKIPQSEIFAGTGSTSKPLKTDKVAVTFLPDPEQRYGFDRFNQELVGNKRYTGNYQSLPDGESQVDISWKSVESGRGDVVLAEVEARNKTVDLSKIRFLNAAGDTLSSSLVGNTFKVAVWGAPEGNNKEINAFYQTGKTKNAGYFIGKLNVASFNKIKKKVVLVPVNGSPVPDKRSVEEYLNTVYRSAVVEWQVDIDPPFISSSWDVNGDGRLEAGSSTMSAYADEQKKLAGLYRQQSSLEDETYYIFLIKDFDVPGQAGYMVRNGQVGFVTAGGEVLRNIAHELGHGAFALQHTWDVLGEETKGTTSNLMDYASGTELWHFQWKYMRNPDIIFRPFEGDDEGAFLGTELYLTPSGYPIKIPDKEIKSFIKPSNIQYQLMGREYPNGALYGYKNVKDEVFIARIKNGEFLGYENQATGEIYKDGNFYSGRQKVFVIEELDDDCRYYLYTVNYEVPAKSSRVPITLNLSQRTKDKILARNRCSALPQDPSKTNVVAGRKNITLFVNGYRFGLPEKPDSDNVITKEDRFQYWEGMDKLFIDRLKSGTVLYADGHHSISTSNHRDMGSFYCSAKTIIPSISSDPKEIVIKNASMVIPSFGSSLSYVELPETVTCFTYTGGKLNEEPNVEGFEKRRQSGRTAATKLLQEIRSGKVVLRVDSIDNILDTLDIVAHSMGYAYALGMTDVLKGKIPFGRFYIIAPENAGSGAIDESDFEEVWQYGSDLNRDDGMEPDPLNKQDGVAPQVKVGGLGRYQRVFIPEAVAKGFLKSHSIGNFQWIFNREKYQKGYVKPRS
ncbi:MAG TPA: fibronectin type III domain-containing protein [Sphingobacteriaceae bacterium]